MEYAVIIMSRNDADFLEKTLESVIKQDVKSNEIVVVNDGSIDHTAKMVKELKQKHRGNIEITLVNRVDRGYSALGTYEMADVINDGYKAIIHNKNWDFLMILGADTILPSNYVSGVTYFMGDEYGVASGRLGSRKKHTNHVPDSGQIMRRDLIDKLGGFPRTYAWNTAILPFARMKGYKTKAFLIPTYSTLRGDNEGYGRSYVCWGRGMKDLGYYPPMAVGRVLKTVLKGHPIQALQMLRGYLFHKPMEKQDWMEFNRKQQKLRLKNGIKKILRMG